MIRELDEMKGILKIENNNKARFVVPFRWIDEWVGEKNHKAQ